MEKITTVSINFFDSDTLKNLIFKVSAPNNLIVEITEPNVNYEDALFINLNKSEATRLIDFLNYIIKN